MRSQEFIAEVPMNPGAYAQSIETGADQGVVVGFEFEVCVPKATITGGTKPKESNDWVNKVDSDWYEYLDIDTDDTYVALTRPVEYQGTEYKSLYDLYAGWRSSKLEAPVKKIFDTIPEADRKKIVAKWNEFKDRHAYGNDIAGFARYLRSWAVDRRDRTNNAVRSEFWQTVLSALYREIEKATDQEFWKQVFGTTKLKELVQVPSLHFNSDEILGSFGDDSDDYYYSQDYDYKGAAKVLKPALEQAFGTVKVFNDYHEKKKDASSWYIEPDGSLTPEDGDGAAEVVSPPMPVKQAVSSLKTFFGIVRQLNLYTNSTTGLHTNVSIPAKLDVLKLAVFLGDEYVLKSWGRLNNDYAESVIASIKTGNGVSDINLKTKTGLKMFQKLAADISDNHTASISYNGKYVSFRHAGGDYLKDIGPVMDVLGRFVRAMVIAADKNAYRTEYLSKLSKLVTTNQATGQQNVLMKISQLKTQPIEMQARIFYGTSAKSTPRNMVSGYAHVGTVAKPAAASQLANAYYQEVYNQVRDETKKQLDTYAKGRHVVAAVISSPGTLNNRSGVSAVYDGSWDSRRLGIYITKDITLQPGTAEHTAYIQSLMQDYKQAMLTRKKNPQVQALPLPETTQE